MSKLMAVFRCINVIKRRISQKFWSHHRTEHALASGEHQTHSHHRQQEKDQPQEGGEQPTATSPLLVLLHAFGQQLRPRNVQGEVRLGPAPRLQTNKALHKVITHFRSEEKPIFEKKASFIYPTDLLCK
ncbi:hypothetical protein TcasGA2_TC008805 [Tribolium castaneum]|uniref:Uncharacterized protein n=1 Tax=Tribolium castaneum TaxID=7070 RepID=D6WRK3_TRICA|nr:hypothetical protein TcasGA2_TC008805 [Tribolium castaneum]